MKIVGIPPKQWAMTVFGKGPVKAAHFCDDSNLFFNLFPVPLTFREALLGLCSSSLLHQFLKNWDNQNPLDLTWRRGLVSQALQGKVKFFKPS